MCGGTDGGIRARSGVRGAVPEFLPLPSRTSPRNARWAAIIPGCSRLRLRAGRSFNGRTRGSGPWNRGSNPCLPAKSRQGSIWLGGRDSGATRLSPLRARILGCLPQQVFAVPSFSAASTVSEGRRRLTSSIKTSKSSAVRFICFAVRRNSGTRGTSWMYAARSGVRALCETEQQIGIAAEQRRQSLHELRLRWALLAPFDAAQIRGRDLQTIRRRTQAQLLRFPHFPNRAPETLRHGRCPHPQPCVYCRATHNARRWPKSSLLVYDWPPDVRAATLSKLERPPIEEHRRT